MRRQTHTHTNGEEEEEEGRGGKVLDKRITRLPFFPPFRARFSREHFRFSKRC